MTTDTAYAIVMLLAVAVNYGTLFIVLPRKLSLRVSILTAVVFTFSFYVLLFFTGNLSNMFGGFRGLVHLPLMVFLFRGQFLQKVFAVLMVMILTGFQISVVGCVVELFFTYGSDAYNLLSSAIILVLFATYFTLVFLFGRRILQKLFFRGQQTEWILYTAGAALSFSVMMVAYNTFTGMGRIAVICFTVWSFVILCFAIINTHEKTRQAYEAKFARDIISSGRDHYQKMNGMYDSLRMLRHDTKYHLDIVSELINSGSKAEAEKYLADVQKQLSENEMRGYCANPVLNALLTSFSERCARLDIDYTVEISMPKSTTLPNYELCMILGNLLENAVEASSQHIGSRRIELILNTQGTHLAIMVKNNFNGKIAQDDGLPVSTKKDGGLGLRSVRAVAANYGGELMTEWDDTMFAAYVLLRV